MDEETQATAKLILGEIARAKQYSKMPQPHDLFLSAETIISGMAYLVGPMLDFENAYKAQIVGYIDDGFSHNKAETKAQMGEAYKNYRKLKYVYDLGEMQTQMLKRFHSVLQDDYKRS